MLLFNGREIALANQRSYVIGRHPECEIVLADRMVSRRHARLRVRGGVLLEDLGATNGVFVDGARIRDVCMLELRARIVIGGTELFLSAQALESRARLITSPRGRPTLPTLPEISPVSRAPDSGDTDRIGYEEVLGDLADKLIARGRGGEAETLVAGHMHNVLEHWRRTGGGDVELAERCAVRALSLAGATRKSEWLEYVFQLYALIGRLMPESLIDESYRVVHRVERPSADALGAYMARLETAELGPSERFRVRRLEGLRRMICAR